MFLDMDGRIGMALDESRDGRRGFPDTADIRRSPQEAGSVHGVAGGRLAAKSEVSMELPSPGVSCHG